MKTITRLSVVCLTLLWAGTAHAQITGTAHDFQLSYGGGEICKPCHIPHSPAENASGPLWNHEVTTTSFSDSLYSSNTLNAIDVGNPTGNSRLCLSCHDGTVAIDSFGGATGSTTIGPTDAANLGTSLSDDHPIAFTYDASLATADGGLVAPVSADAVDSNLPLFSAKVECATCHDVHYAGNSNFLRVNNSASALCLSCHIK